MFLNGARDSIQGGVVGGCHRRPKPGQGAPAGASHLCLVEVVLVDVVIVVPVIVIVVVVIIVVYVGHDIGDGVGRYEHEAEEVGHREAVPGVHVPRRWQMRRGVHSYGF